MREEVRAFKNELRNYRYYQKLIVKLNENKDYYYHSISGMTGRGFGEPSGSTNQSIKEEHRLDVIDKIEKIDRHIEEVSNKLSYIQKVLSKIDSRTRNIMISVYADGQTYLSMAKKENYNPRTLQQQVDKAIYDYFKHTRPGSSEK